MRYLKVLLLTLFFFVSMVFFIQNNEMLAKELVLKLELFNLGFVSHEMPFYLIVLLSFVVGSVFSMSYFLAEKLRLSHELKASKAKLAALEQEVTSLRNLPLEEEVYPSTASKSESTPSATSPYPDEPRSTSATSSYPDEPRPTSATSSYPDEPRPTSGSSHSADEPQPSSAAHAEDEPHPAREKKREEGTT